MLLSTFIPKGITWFNSRRDACERGSFFVPHISCLRLSQCLPLAEHPTMLFQGQAKFFCLWAICPIFF